MDLTWITPSTTRNYALNNTIIDWFNFHGEKNGFVKDTTKFTPAIMEGGHKFEEGINIQLEEKFGKDYIHLGGCHQNSSSIELYENTLKALKDGIPIISSGVLRDEKNKVYGCPDLMIRSDYFDKIVEFSPFTDLKYSNYNLNAASPLIGGKNYHYFVVDVKHTTLHLSSNGININKTGSIPAYKVQIYLYHRMLSEVQGFNGGLAFILGKGFQFKSRDETFKGKWNERFGLIDYNRQDKDYIEVAEKAINWLREVQTHGGDWDVYKPNRAEMYPNMSCDSNYPWEGAKKQVAKKIEEISMIWYCGADERNNAHKKDIFKLSHPDLSASKMEVKYNDKKRTIDDIIKINLKTNDKLIETHGLIIPETEHEFYVDFETMNNHLDDTLNIDSSFIYMIGVVHKHRGVSTYKCFVTEDFNHSEEEKTCYEFVDFLNSIQGDKVLFHWAKHEKSVWSKVLSRHPKVNEMWLKYNVKWEDLCDMFIRTPVVVKGAYNFSIKTIANAMYSNGLIRHCYIDSAIANGMEATIEVLEARKTAREKSIKLSQTDTFKEVIKYNELDCILLDEIVDCVRRQ